ncbi:MAG: hypothetical protein RL685_4972 [Pseudomonadota bacterium]|jgi:hypothetical protein
MQLRARSVITLGLAIATCGACGGRASDRERSIDLDGAPDPQSVEPPAEELPDSFEVLELRLSGDTPAPAGPYTCDPDGYSTRYKLNGPQRLLIWGQCEATGESIGMSSSNVTLGDADFARVQAVYEGLRISSAKQCEPDPALLTLEVSTDHRTHILYGDDEHSDCPLPGLQRDRYVAGLDELHALLASLATR